jgi:hypothetical protein
VRAGDGLAVAIQLDRLIQAERDDNDGDIHMYAQPDGIEVL